MSTFFIWSKILVISGIGSILIGCFLAINEPKLKKFLANTSINQTGFLLVGISCCTIQSLIATIFFFLTYTFIMCVFLITLLYSNIYNAEIEHISWFKLLSQSKNCIPFLLSFTLFNMAGFPPTLGFVSKFYLFLEIGLSGHWELIIFGLFSNLLSSFYYLRIIFTMFFERVSITNLLTFSFSINLSRLSTRSLNNNIIILSGLYILLVFLFFFCLQFYELIAICTFSLKYIF